MGLVKDKSVKHDQYTWRCAPCKKGKITMNAGLRAGSFFENLKVTIQEMLYLAADWVENPEKKIKSVAKQHKINRKTVMEAHEWFRRMTMQWFLRVSAADPDLKLGGPGTVVEIDETLVYRAKYNRGRMLRRKQVWVFGMIQRATSNIVMFRVPRRNADTLLPLIAKYVKPGTTIVSDGWAAYGGVNIMQAGFAHRWVNHKINFVDPSDSAVHTQSIEASWNALKTDLRSRCGVPVERLEGHMFNYIWRRAHNREKLLNRLIYEMKTFKRDQPDEERVEVEDAAVDDPDSDEDEETDGDKVVRSTSCESSTSEDNFDDDPIVATAAVARFSNPSSDYEDEETGVATDAVEPSTTNTVPESILKRARDRDSGLSSDIDIEDNDVDEEPEIASTSQIRQHPHSVVNHSPAQRQNRGGHSGTSPKGKNNRGRKPKELSRTTGDVPTTPTSPPKEADDMEPTSPQLPPSTRAPGGATRRSAKARSPSTQKATTSEPETRQLRPRPNQKPPSSSGKGTISKTDDSLRKEATSHGKKEPATAKSKSSGSPVKSSPAGMKEPATAKSKSSGTAVKSSLAGMKEPATAKSKSSGTAAKPSPAGIKEPAAKKSKFSGSPVKSSAAGSASKSAVLPSGKAKSPSKGSVKRGKNN